MSWHKQRPPAPAHEAKTAMTEEWALRNEASGRVTHSRPREAALRHFEGWTTVRRYVTNWEEA